MSTEAFRFAFARHAESDANATDLLSSDPSRPVALTPRGRAQARALGAQLANLPIGLAVGTRLLHTRQTIDLALDGAKMENKRLMRNSARRGRRSRSGAWGWRVLHNPPSLCHGLRRPASSASPTLTRCFRKMTSHDASGQPRNWSALRQRRPGNITRSRDAPISWGSTNHPDRATPTHLPWRDAQSVSKEGSQAAAPS
jgi:hypothetical protein